MDAIFGNHENIVPSFIANRSTDIDSEDSSSIESKLPKKSKKNHIDFIVIAITTMSETRKRVWKKKLELELKKIMLLKWVSWRWKNKSGSLREKR